MSALEAATAPVMSPRDQVGRFSRKHADRECPACRRMFQPRRADTIHCSRACFANNRARTPIEDRFWALTMPEPNSGCWFWLGELDDEGYGHIWTGTKKTGVHRASYAMFVGPFPEELTIDHLCRVRFCVNPAHLEPVPIAVNVLRSPIRHRHAKKTHCPRGHAYAGDNVSFTKRGTPVCRACRREKYRARKASEALPSRAYASRTHCPKGHPYTGDNLYLHPKGGRGCRACRREQGAAGKARATLREGAR